SPGRAPPQGARVSLVATVQSPHGPEHGFDERTWLRRKGIHVVLHADEWRLVGRRHGLGGLADRLRLRVERPLERGTDGERRAVPSCAWLAARQRGRWHFLLLAALILLAWNPATLFDAGFQLSFVAVAAIFTLVPRLLDVLEGYPLPKKLAQVVAVSTVCGAA